MTKAASHKKRTIAMIVFIVVVFGGVIGFNQFKSHMINQFFKTYAPPAVTVSTVKAQKSSWHPNLDAIGNFLAVNGVDVNAETSGNIVEIAFRSGQHVEKGQPLVTIDDSILQAQLKFNEAQLDLQQLSFKRQDDLFRRGATSSSNLDEAKANLDQAQANVDKVKAEINQKHIKAPFSGRLGIRLVNLGQYVSPGQTSIVTLQSLDPLFLEFYLPESRLNDLYVGQNIYFQSDNFPNYQYTGKITAINAKVDPKMHNIKIQATIANCPEKALNNPEQSSLVKTHKHPGYEKTTVICNTALNDEQNITKFAFIPGMFASIEVEQKEVKDKIVLPATAVAYSLYGNSVYVVEADKETTTNTGEKPTLRAHRTFVKTGAQQGGYVLVEDGLEEGQEVVNSGAIKLQNGTVVKVDNSISLTPTDNTSTLKE